MTRDELERRLGRGLQIMATGSDAVPWDTAVVPMVEAAMQAVDEYVATQRAEIEQQIGEHVRTRLAAERERKAQEIEQQATEMQDGRLLGRDRGAEARSYLAAGMRMAAQTVREDERHD